MRTTLFALSLSFLGPSAALFAQRDTAAGQVRDTTKAAVPGAKVIVRHAARNVERTGTSGPEGFYVFAALPAGTYTITVTQEGFHSQNILLQVDQQATVDIELRVGAVTALRCWPARSPTRFHAARRCSAWGRAGRSPCPDLPTQEPHTNASG